MTITTKNTYILQVQLNNNNNQIDLEPHSENNPHYLKYHLKKYRKNPSRTALAVEWTQNVPYFTVL